MCDIASKKEIETRELYNMNWNRIIDFKRIHNKNEVALYCRKCDADFASQDEYKLNPEELLALFISNGYLGLQEEI